MSNQRNVEVKIIRAFTDNGEGGNPAGVVLDADQLTNSEKLAVAQKLGLSETAFVSKSTAADFKLDFFTPSRQIAHCGHATIATFSHLFQSGRIQNASSSKETIDGNRSIVFRNGFAFMEQTPPIYHPINQMEVLASLGLQEKDLIPGTKISIVNTGNSFAIIPVRTPEILRDIQPAADLISCLSEEYDLVGYYVFCTQSSSSNRDASARMFAPRYGIHEEAATGMAAGPLACFLYDKLGQKKTSFQIEQGWFMETPSKSLIITELVLEQDKIFKLITGGASTVQTDFLTLQI